MAQREVRPHLTDASGRHDDRYYTEAEVDTKLAGVTATTNLAATLSATNVVVTSDTGADATIPAADATNAGVMTAADKTLLDGRNQKFTIGQAVGPNGVPSFEITDPAAVTFEDAPFALTRDTITRKIHFAPVFGAVAGTFAEGNHTHTTVFAIPLSIDGGGSVITVGVKGEVTIPFAATVTGWRIKSPKEAGSIVVTVSRASYVDYPTFTAISGTEKPTLSAAQKNEDRSLTTWTTALNADDELQISVDSATTTTLVNLTLFLTRTS